MAREILARRPAHVRVLELRGDRANAGVLTPIDLGRQARSVVADAVWSPGFLPPLFRVAGKRFAITIHDLAHLHHYSVAHRIYYRAVIRPLLRNVDCIFTVSEFTRREIASWAPESEGKIVCVYNGVSDTFQVAGSVRHVDIPYVLYVGNRRSYKNVQRLITAFAKSSLRSYGYQLWLTGHDDTDLSGWAVREGVGDRVRFLGQTSDDELAAIYRGARALAFMSLYEGFGLPVVEAMACGCPVLTSNTTALSEVAGLAALQVDPLSIGAMARGLEQICFDERMRAGLVAAGLQRAREFDWDVAALIYWSSLQGKAIPPSVSTMQARRMLTAEV